MHFPASERPKVLWLGVALILAALIGGNITVAGSAVGPVTPWLVRLCIGGIGAVLALAATVTTSTVPAIVLEEEAWRSKLIRATRRIWIDGFLANSMRKVVRIELGLVDDPSFVESPLALLTQVPGRDPLPVPAGTPLVKVFDGFDGAMLIVGEPGAGKTTLLLELARDLLERADCDPAAPVPVVLILTPWTAEPTLTLAEWMVKEIERRYYIPAEVSRACMSAGTLVALLDGLDEVAADRRQQCVQAIEAYRQGHGGPPVVVTCRRADYEALPRRMRMEGAVLVEPLDPVQVQRYLDSGGEALAGLRAAVVADPDLMELLVTPQWLSTAALAYHNPAGTQLSSTPGEDETMPDRRAALYERYIASVFARRAPNPAYTKDQTIQYLSWLAETLKTHDATVLHLEQIQANWLPSRQDPRFVTIGVPIMCGLLVGLLAGLLAGLLIGPAVGLGAGLVGGLVGGLVFGLTVGLVDGQVIAPTRTLRWWLSKLRRGSGIRLAARLVVVLPVGLVIGLASGLTTGLLGGLVGGLVFGLAVGLTVGLVGGQTIAPARTLRWSLSNLRRSLDAGLTAGLAVGLVFGLDVGLAYGLDVGLVVGLATGLTVVLAFGLAGELPEPGEGEAPYDVLNRSARIALATALATGLAFGLAFGLPIGLTHGLTVGLATGLAAGVSAGLTVGLAFGGYACVYHLVLRWRLVRAGAAPWRYVEFLDHSTDRLLLRRVGSGYAFMHRTLRDYIATGTTTAETTSC